MRLLIISYFFVVIKIIAEGLLYLIKVGKIGAVFYLGFSYYFELLAPWPHYL